MTNGEIIEQLENTIGLIKQDGKDWLDDRDIPILEACIKSLTALDKIRAEIEKAVWEDVIVSLDGTDEVRIQRLEPDDVFEIIDKYKAENEPQERSNKE